MGFSTATELAIDHGVHHESPLRIREFTKRPFAPLRILRDQLREHVCVDQTIQSASLGPRESLPSVHPYCPSLSKFPHSLRTAFDEPQHYRGPPFLPLPETESPETPSHRTLIGRRLKADLRFFHVSSGTSATIRGWERGVLSPVERTSS
jgi:hypothetical protein